MQRELVEKDEKIRILEAKNETLRQTVDAKTSEVENFKQRVVMLEQEVMWFTRIKLCVNTLYT